MTKEAHRQMLIDTFVNAVFVHDDKLLLTFNFKDGTRTITLNDVKEAACSSGSDLDCFVAPNKKGTFRVPFLFGYGIRTRTHINADIRWTSAATSANTGGSHNIIESGCRHQTNIIRTEFSQWEMGSD